MECDYCNRRSHKILEDKNSFQQMNTCNGLCTIPSMANRMHIANETDLSYPKHKGVLSIKYMIDGRSHYQLDNREYVVREGEFLLLDQPSDYSSNLGMGRSGKILCIYFQNDYAKDVISTIRTGDEQLLDDPSYQIKDSIHFIEKIYGDLTFARYLDQIALGIETGKYNDENIHEEFYNLFNRLLLLHAKTTKEFLSIPSKKRSTREELYRRLHLAKDAISSQYRLPIDLNSLSQISCLSKYHLLREFKRQFDTTPHEYLMSIRLEEAKEMLTASEKPINQVASDTGFTSKHYFSLFFKSRVGITPSQFRAEGTRSKG